MSIITEAPAKEHALSLHPGEVQYALKAAEDGLRQLIVLPLKHQPKSQGRGVWTVLRSRNQWATNKRIEVLHSANKQPKVERKFNMPVEEWLVELCPYQVGHNFWVRETFAVRDDIDVSDEHGIAHARHYTHYKADNTGFSPSDPDNWHDWERWRSPNSMPRWASRIDLKVVSVTACRIQDLCITDFRRMGLDLDVNARAPGGGVDIKKFVGGWYRIGLRHLQQTKRFPQSAYKDNHWVYVVEIERIKT